MKILCRLFATHAIGIRQGKAVKLKGKLTHSQLLEIGETASVQHIESGEIWIGATGKVTFSKEIPASKHQPLRNTINSI